MHACAFCTHSTGPIYVVDEKDISGQPTGNKLRICHTCHSLGLGGAAHQPIQLDIHTHQPIHPDAQLHQFARPGVNPTKPKTKK
ncbi:hypothetical protein KDK_13590 [Dictyobacter kobayashii]|uniref:Uncharacterized protein n=1 Tax=Dictyobacter kobayashii TaxID=2014872 RepID=A0A402AEN1_9CHLR|nr:hypothetical protein KDK_13590 [Dictyobacter kobayashii]